MTQRRNQVGRLVFGALIGIGMQMAVIETSAAQTTTAAQAAVDAGKPAAFILLLRLRGDLYSRWKASGTWPDDAAANKALAEHGRYWAQHRAAGERLIGVGPHLAYGQQGVPGSILAKAAFLFRLTPPCVGPGADA